MAPAVKHKIKACLGNYTKHERKQHGCCAQYFVIVCISFIFCFSCAFNIRKGICFFYFYFIIYLFIFILH